MSALPRIFVVDDEIAAREMVGDYLRMHGFEVSLCEGGAHLRRELADHKPDLIVLDLNMPEEDGLSIIRYLKQTCPVPVIMLTATASAIDRVVGLEMGADDYLAKPCELRELLARIRSVLRRLKWSPAQKAERRLAAIVSFDFVGFGRYIQENETDTLAALDRIFSELITPSLARFRGHLFKMLGDGALLEFGSVVDAVEWSVFFQRSISDYSAGNFSVGPIRFRVGIAVGDVVVHESDRLGEGVTLAVRVQECAAAGGVALSDNAYHLIRGKTQAGFRDAGLQSLKNISDPMHIWTWDAQVRAN
jgi:class 3 adenylate cyclase